MIEEILLKYKGLTEAIIVNVKNDLDGEEILKKRGDLLVKLLDDKTFNKEEIKSIYINLGIENLDKLLKKEIDKGRERNKEDIKEMKQRKKANQAYESNINSISTFSKKF